MDTQSTLPLGRGDSLVLSMHRAAASTADAVLNLEAMQHACGQVELPAGTCRDMEVYSRESPGTVADFVFRYEMDEPDRAFECVKWVRIVARYHGARFEALDPQLGGEAKGLHEASLQILLEEAKLQEANVDFQTRAKVIRSLAVQKTKQLMAGPSHEFTQQRLEQIETWVQDTINKSEAPRQQVKAILDEHIARLMCHVDAMLTGAQEQHEAKTRNTKLQEEEKLLLQDLEAHLDGPPPESLQGASRPAGAAQLLKAPEAGGSRPRELSGEMLKSTSVQEASLATVMIMIMIVIMHASMKRIWN